MSGFTQNYQLEYLAPGQPARDTRAVFERAMKAVDAALTRGGIAPPNAQDAVALAGRIAALEAPPTAYGVALDPNYKTAAAGDSYGPLTSLKYANGRVMLSGAITNQVAPYNAAAGSQYFLGTLNSNTRPTKIHRFIVSLAAGSSWSSANVIIGPDGLVYMVPLAAVTAGFLLDLSNVQFQLGY